MAIQFDVSGPPENPSSLSKPGWNHFSAFPRVDDLKNTFATQSANSRTAALQNKVARIATISTSASPIDAVVRCRLCVPSQSTANGQSILLRAGELPRRLAGIEERQPNHITTSTYAKRFCLFRNYCNRRIRDTRSVVFHCLHPSPVSFAVCIRCRIGLWDGCSGGREISGQRGLVG